MGAGNAVPRIFRVFQLKAGIFAKTYLFYKIGITFKQWDLWHMQNDRPERRGCFAGIGKPSGWKTLSAGITMARLSLSKPSSLLRFAHEP
jgi:hypothetical protein